MTIFLMFSMMLFGFNSIILMMAYLNKYMDMNFKLLIFNMTDNLHMGMSMEIFNLLFMFLVALISMLIYMYCYFYMGKSSEMPLFSWILFYFIVSMLILLSSSKFLNYILGWDGLGVSSFLLVIYYKNLMSTRSGLATFITNRMGDFFIIISFILMMMSENINSNNIKMLNMNSMNVLLVLMLLLGCATKSAQLPFSAWLPAAMAAPTPVSALVHSSTLVTAGIFLMTKFMFLLEDMNNNITMMLCMFLSFIAGIMAFYENDFKKLIAMSTLSQLGIMGYSLFSKSSDNCLFHTLSHATFKSLLFLTAGSLILFNMGAQDIRIKTMPKNMMMTPMILFICSTMSLMGLIFSSGFYSKDLIILDMYMLGNNVITYFTLLLACTATVLYSLKSFILVFNNEINSNPMIKTVSSYFMLAACFFLFIIMMSFGNYMFFLLFEKEEYIVEQMNKIMGVIIMFLGMVLIRMSWAPMLNKINEPAVSNNINKKSMEFINQMTNMNWLSNNYLSSKFKNTNFMSWMETNWWEFLTDKLAYNSQNSFKKEVVKINNPQWLTNTEYFLVLFLLLIFMFSFF